MADKIRGKKKNETTTKAAKFTACGQSIFGGFDERGDEPGRNPQGSDCVGGMRTWWGRTSATSERLERISGPCKCLREWRAAQTPTEEPAEPAAPRSARAYQQSFADGKSRAAQ